MARICLGLGVLLAIACGPLKEPRELVVAQQTEPSTLDPHLANEMVVWSTLSNIVEGLVRFSPKIELAPSLAVKWEQLSPTTWRFTLRPGVLFHNGRPLQAEDVAASFLRAQTHPRSKVRHFLAGVVRVMAETNNQVLVETASPIPTLLRRLAFVLVVPKEQCREDEIAKPIGTGPFRVVAMEGSSLQLQAVRWWGGTPLVRSARILFIESDEERSRDFFAGKVDVCVWPRETDLSEVRSQKGLFVVQQPRLTVQLLAINPEAASGKTRRALADVRVRRALLYALDRERLIREVAGGNGTVASQLVHPLVFGFDPAIESAPFDPERAKALLAEAGFANGFDVELGGGGATLPTLSRIAEDWAKIGVKARISLHPFPQLLALARSGRLPVMFFARSCTTSDASEVLDSTVHCSDPAKGLGVENYARLCNPKIDQLLEEASQELDPEKRQTLLQRAQRQVLEQAFYLPLIIRWGYLGIRQPWKFVPRYDQYIFLADFTLDSRP